MKKSERQCSDVVRSEKEQMVAAGAMSFPDGLNKGGRGKKRVRGLVK